MNRDFYLWCDAVAHITPLEMKTIKEHIDIDSAESVEEIYRTLGDTEGKRIENIMEKLMKEKYDADIVNELTRELKKEGAGYITSDDEEFSGLLKEIYDCPYIVYYIGDREIFDYGLTMAVVGSRKSSTYGKSVTEKIVMGLARSGFIIVSGLATGVDSYSHRFCMEYGMPTIAVLGTAINQIYPLKNRKLYHEILENGGLIISEHFVDKPGDKAYFARRNRIISGISRGVVVTEAEKKSGTMITVDTALQQGRNVYVVPGSIFSKLSEGCNNLAKEGAKLTTSYMDIVEDYQCEKYSFFINKLYNNKKNNKNSGKNSESCVKINEGDNKTGLLTKEEASIYNILLSKGEMSIDQLSEISGQSTAVLMPVLIKLSIKGKVIDLGNNMYSPK